MGIFDGSGGGLSGLFAMGGYGGGTGAGFNPSDPNALAHALQMHAALGMLQSGSDSSPARSAWQGIDRGANAIMGALMMRNMMHPGGAQPGDASNWGGGIGGGISNWMQGRPWGAYPQAPMVGTAGSSVAPVTSTPLPPIGGG